MKKRLLLLVLLVPGLAHASPEWDAAIGDAAKSTVVYVLGTRTLGWVNT